MLLLVAVPLAGCAAAEKTGDVGNKNLRPYSINDHERHGLPINGVHSSDSPTYRMKSERHPYNHQDEWMLRNRMGNNWVGAHGNDKLEMDDKLAQQLEKLPGVRQAYVLVTEKNVYVGIEEEQRGDRSDANYDVQPELREKIIARIGASLAGKQVLITAHPEYLERMKIYSDAELNGHPVREYLAEFNALAARIFPAVTYMDNAGRSVNTKQP